jgi:ATP-binding cassette subfamily B protein
MLQVMMTNLCDFSHRPVAFFLRYLRRRPISHSAIFLAVLMAVACSVGAQYGIKFLVDTLANGTAAAASVWHAFAVLVALIAADNLLWRLASWIGIKTFVGVTGDVRRDLFRHLTGHAPSYFVDRLPGTLTSRITATSNAVFIVENMLVWNVLPPCLATLLAIALVFTVSGPMAAVLVTVACLLVTGMFRRAAAGAPLHHAFADKAAAVDGEMIDIVGNMSLVRAFGGLKREHVRFDDSMEREMHARRNSLVYLEKLRLAHAVTTVVLTIGLLAWAITLWQAGRATTGEVVLICTLGMSVLHATRDLAVALVDVTQHIARLSEALVTLLVPHELQDHPEAVPLSGEGASIQIDKVHFNYPDGRKVFHDFNLEIAPGQRVGVVGPSGGGKSTVFALLQRFYDVQDGQIRINGEDIKHVTQESLRSAIALVPQDVCMFHRSVLENVRYGRPEANDEEVMKAMVAARCVDFVDELPYGVRTIMGERGVKLSPGQRQRIAIARAFLKDAPVLLLDEATSALDSESEEAVREALDRLMVGRTVIAIAHRLSTLRSFDRIVVLRAGCVVEDGSPGRLVRCDGIYQQLVRREMSRLELAREAA